MLTSEFRQETVILNQVINADGFMPFEILLIFMGNKQEWRLYYNKSKFFLVCGNKF